MLGKLRDRLQLYLVTDDQEDLYQRTEAAIRGGVTCVQLRMKKASSRQFLETGKRFKELCQKYQIPLVINDRADVALLAQADMLHIGQNDLSIQEARQIVGLDMPIGVSVHSVEEAVQAKQDGASYLGVGSMFPTSSKDDATIVSIKTLSSIREAVSLPIVLIGGINQKTLPALAPYIPDGVAIISGILSAPCPKSMASYFKKELEKLV
ncbi:thiamine phosphate synthase [Hazenella coriacea]|uniref:Thiamine-phosphate synthase n=1 Tax=Hazenella coriacea TaxID=1179467 RepID=A0A4R3LBE1_9BACL|nr:thiamine phosphate synthase [Hazenella coriacea]TCS94836.1 thiamine-phosphate diphosphorylase [Hazenella coriacea]